MAKTISIFLPLDTTASDGIECHSRKIIGLLLLLSYLMALTISSRDGGDTSSSAPMLSLFLLLCCCCGSWLATCASLSCLCSIQLSFVVVLPPFDHLPLVRQDISFRILAHCGFRSKTAPCLLQYRIKQACIPRLRKLLQQMFI